MYIYKMLHRIIKVCLIISNETYRRLSNNKVLYVEKLLLTSIDVIGTCLKKVMSSAFKSSDKPSFDTPCSSGSF